MDQALWTLIADDWRQRMGRRRYSLVTSDELRATSTRLPRLDGFSLAPSAPFRSLVLVTRPSSLRHCYDPLRAAVRLRLRSPRPTDRASAAGRARRVAPAGRRSRRAARGAIGRSRTCRTCWLPRTCSSSTTRASCPRACSAVASPAGARSSACCCVSSTTSGGTCSCIPGQKMKPGTRAGFGEPPAGSRPRCWRSTRSGGARFAFGRLTAAASRKSSTPSGTCRCRRTSSATTARPIASDTRPSMPAAADPSRRRRPGSISRRRCSTALEARGVTRAEVTLHVGYGTFEPVRTDIVEEHRIHPEPFEIDASERPPPSRRHSARAGASSASGRPRRARSKPWPPTHGGVVHEAVRRGVAVHLSRLPLSGGGRPAHQLPSAEVVAAAAGVRVCRHRADACGLPARDRRGLSVLQLWGRDADPVIADCRLQIADCRRLRITIGIRRIRSAPRPVAGSAARGGR